MGTALVVLFLLAVCGLIAYIGDLLGRRMGKKRLSAFGLRPKHTAILFTIVTGVLIACVSLGHLPLLHLVARIDHQTARVAFGERHGHE